VTRPLEYRSAETAAVSFPQRMIEVVVMPYEREATVGYQDRLITEICSRGAWDGIETRPTRIKANRDHDTRRSVGRAKAFYPSRVDGLVARLEISRTELGDETLVLAEDGVLDVSAGFRPMDDGGEVWENRDRRRLVKCWLGHIAFVPDPAYEDAKVLAVRQTDEVAVEVAGTPVLDRILAERAAREYGLSL
jgi:HK97 family phage prohead protease